MKLMSGTFKATNSFVANEGIPVDLYGQKDAPSVWEAQIGRTNKTGNYSRFRLGAPFASQLAKDAPCSRDGDATLGKCPECKIVISDTDIKKIWEKYPGTDFTVWKPVAAHTLATKVDPVQKGTFLTVSVRDYKAKKNEKKLLLVEERQNDQHGQLGLLIYAEPHKGEKTLIATERFQPEPYNKAIGQRWLGSEVEDGIGVERLLILRPGDRIMVKRYRGNPDRTKDVHFLIVMPDLTVKVAEKSEVQRIEPAKEAQKTYVTVNSVVETPKEPAPGTFHDGKGNPAPVSDNKPAEDAPANPETKETLVDGTLESDLEKADTAIEDAKRMIGAATETEVGTEVADEIAKALKLDEPVEAGSDTASKSD